MSWYRIGDYIHDMRKKYGITQEQLSEGICSTGTLSRIENNSQIPTINTCKALLERLGEAPKIFTGYANEEEIESYRRGRRLLRLMASQSFDEISVPLAEYLQGMDEEDKINWQLAIYTSAVCHAVAGKHPKVVWMELVQALQMTMIREQNLRECWQRRSLTYEEILILNNIAIQRRRMGEAEAAEQILYELQIYVSCRMKDEEEQARLHPMILNNLAKWLNEKGCHKEAILHCDMGIEICRKYGKLFPLPYLLYQKAEALEQLAMTHEAEVSYTQARALMDILCFERMILSEEIMVAI